MDGKYKKYPLTSVEGIFKSNYNQPSPATSFGQERKQMLANFVCLAVVGEFQYQNDKFSSPATSFGQERKQMLANFVCLAVVGEVNKEQSSNYRVFKKNI